MSQIETLKALLKERHEFPERPGPADGEVSDEAIGREQEAWDEQWGDLDQRISAALRSVETI